MRHCWTDRYEASGSEDRTQSELDEIKRRWPNGPLAEEWEAAFETVTKYLGETCMLRAGHKGPHKFQPMDSIVIKFGDSVEVVL